MFSLWFDGQCIIVYPIRIIHVFPIGFDGQYIFVCRLNNIKLQHIQQTPIYNCVRWSVINILHCFLFSVINTNTIVYITYTSNVITMNLEG